MKEKSGKIKRMFAAIIAVQFVCVFIIIAEIIAIKYFSPKNYKKISAFFENKMCEETNANELLNLFEDEI